MNYRILLFFSFITIICSCDSKDIHKPLNHDIYEESIYTVNDYKLRGEVKEMKEYGQDTTKPATYTFDKFGNLENYWDYDGGRKEHVYENEIKNGKVIKFSWKSRLNNFTHAYPVDEFEYDENSNLIKFSEGTSKESADEWIEYGYNENGDVVWVEYESKRHGKSENVTRKIEYDDIGRMSQRIQEYKGIKNRISRYYYYGDSIVIDSMFHIDNSLLGFIKYKYDNDKLVGLIEKSAGSTEPYRISKNSYNEKGDMVTEKVDIIDNEYEKDVNLKYEYDGYDTEGNWLKRETYENGRLKETHTRKIDYYRRKYLF